MQWLRSLVFTAFLFAWSFLYAVFFVLVSWTMPVPRRYRLAAWYARRLLNALRIVCRLDYEVTGLENLPAEPHVVLWKHSSAWETFSPRKRFGRMRSHNWLARSACSAARP